MQKRKAIFWISILLLSTITGVFSIENVEADDVTTTLELEPTDDAYVDSEYPNNNYGSGSRLEILDDISDNKKESYIKFNLSTIHPDSTINEAVLKIYVNFISSPIYKIYLWSVDNNLWGENAINWTNKPGHSACIDEIDVDSEDKWYLLNVTDTVKDALSDENISFVLVPENEDYFIHINAKESGTTHSPKLNVSYTPPPPFAADFSYGIPGDGLKVNFTDLSAPGPDRTITSWSWDFGDENSSTDQNSTHVYSENGTYVVNLTVTNDDIPPETSYKTQEINISNAAPTANFTYSPTFPDVDEPIQFTNTSTDIDGTITNYLWDFGDETTSDKKDPIHTYSTIGTYNVTLKVTDNNNATDTTDPMAIVTKQFYQKTSTLIDQDEEIDFKNDANLSVHVKVEDTITVNVTKFGGNPANGELASDVVIVGNYVDVELGDWDYVDGTVQIRMYYTDQELTDAGISENNIVIYYWNASTEKWINYVDCGVNVDDNYCWANVTHLTPLVLGGYANKKPAAYIDSITPDSPKEGDTITFTGHGVDPDGDEITGWNWRALPGGELSTEASFSTSSLMYLTYEIYFSVQDENGEWSDEILQTLEVGPPAQTDDDTDNDDTGNDNEEETEENTPPTANAGGPYYEIIGVPIIFDGSGSNDHHGTITLYSWNFGDGTTGNGISSTHTYTEADEYTVTLTVTDDDGATHSDTTTAIITGGANKVPNKPTITGNETGTIDTNYTYTVQAEDPDGDTVCYIFDWGDNSESTTTEYVASNTTVDAVHKWVEPGAYILTVYTKDVENATSEYEKMLVIIDVNLGFISDEIDGYLIDYNQDGVYTKFYNNETTGETNVEKQEDGTYLIDSNGDDTWDYSYDPVTKTLTAYEPATTGTDLGGETDSNADYTIIYIAIAGIVVIGAVGFLCYKNQKIVIKILKQILETLKQIPKKLGIKQTMSKGMKKRRKKGKK